MTNVVVEIVSDTSVRVSWDSVDIPEITGYTVYYSQTGNRKRQSEDSITVPSSDNFVVIEGLLNNVEYQFQVAAIAEVDGETIVGQRSIPDDMAVILVVFSAAGSYHFTLAVDTLKVVMFFFYYTMYLSMAAFSSDLGEVTPFP